MADCAPKTAAEELRVDPTLLMVNTTHRARCPYGSLTTRCPRGTALEVVVGLVRVPCLCDVTFSGGIDLFYVAIRKAPARPGEPPTNRYLSIAGNSRPG